MSSTSPFISVIMPAYNCEKFVKQAIDSVLSQTEADFELLIMDDYSSDNTKQIIDQYKDSRIRRFHNAVNKGYLVASNLLLKEVRGRFIVFQDADDYASPRRFELLASFLKSNSEVYAVGSNVTTVDTSGKEISHSDFSLLHEDILENFRKYRTTIVGSALMFRKEILDTIGYYHKFFDRIGWEDFYWYSLIIQKHKVANIAERLYFYRSNPNSVSLGNQSFRSVAGFQTIVYYLNERMNGKQDHIQLGDYRKVDEMMARFYISERTSQKQEIKFRDIKKIAPDYLSALKLWLFSKKLANKKN